MNLNDVKEKAKRTINDYINNESKPNYHGSVQAVAQNLDQSELKQIYLKQYPHKSLGVKIGTITPEQMARRLIDGILVTYYLTQYPSQYVKVKVGSVTYEDMFNDLRDTKKNL